MSSMGKDSKIEDTRVEDSGIAYRVTKRQKLARNCKRFWWAWLSGFLLFVLVIVIIVFVTPAAGGGGTYPRFASPAPVLLTDDRGRTVSMASSLPSPKKSSTTPNSPCTLSKY
jgi:hypothetical protein